MHKFLKFILELNSTFFGHFLCPSSGGFIIRKFVTMHEYTNVKLLQSFSSSRVYFICVS
jgi:hypothetical protein